MTVPAGQEAPSILVAALGSAHGDDRAGWAIADRLGGHLPAQIAVRKVAHPLELLDLLEGQEQAVIVDAAQPATNPGMVHCLHWPCAELLSQGAVSTHGFGLREVLSLAEVLGRLPRRVTIFAIEAQHGQPAEGLTGLVEQAVASVVAALQRELVPPR